MTTQTFPPTLAGQTAALAVPGPSNVIFSNGAFIVFTGADYTAPTPLSQDQIDALAARSYAPLVTLMGMTPAQIQAWVAANVTNLAQAQSAISTLSTAVGVLARRL